MKRADLLLALILLLFACKNDQAIDSAFSKYNHREGIVSITVPGFLIRTFTDKKSLGPEERELLQQVEKVKIISVEDHAAYRNINFYDEFRSLIEKENYTELLSAKSYGDDVKILAKVNRKKQVKDLLIIANGNDNAMIYVKGDFTLDKLAELANKTNNKQAGAFRDLLNFQ